MGQYTTFVAARGTEKVNSATKPVVITRSSCNSNVWQSEWGFTLTALESTVLPTKYVKGLNVSLAGIAWALLLGIKTNSCNRLCLLLCLAMVTIDTLIGVRDSYFRKYSGIDSVVCKVVLNNKLYFLFLVYNVSLQDTTQQNWRPRPSAHGECVASLSSLKFIFFFQVSHANTPADSLS